MDDGGNAAASDKRPRNARQPLGPDRRSSPAAQPIAIAPAPRARPRTVVARSYDVNFDRAPSSSIGGGLPGDDDSRSLLTPGRGQAGAALERSEVARRLRQHLVTRPATRHSAAPDWRSTTCPVQPHSFNAAALARPIGGGALAGGRTCVALAEDAGLPEDAAATVVADPMLLPSGDVTYGIYRWQSMNDSDNDSGVGAEASRRGSAAAMGCPRRRSFSGWDSEDPDRDPALRPAQLNVPGGFRRQFVRERAARQGRAPPGFIAETFVDFVALYGHFAGGNYLSDDDRDYFDDVHATAAAAQEAPADEQAPLRGPGPADGAAHGTASLQKAFFLLIKAFVGTGVLVLPRAFYNGGLLTSCVLMVAVAWYAWHCILLLAEVYLRVGGGSYSDIGLRLYGRWMQYAVISSIVLAQIGGCCAYTIFVAQNWRSVFNAVGGHRVQLSTEFWIVAQAAVFVPLALIRQIRYFAPVALVANVLIIASLGYLLGFDVWHIAAHGPAPFANYNPARFPLLVGTAVYSFEGVTLVIPILESLHDKRGFARVLTIAITLCLGLFVCVGSLSYLTFGELVNPVVLLNLPDTSAWTLLVQLLYSIAILFSMPLQLFPAVRIMEDMMFTRSGRDHKYVKWQKNLFRTATVLLISLIAIYGADRLDNVVSLVGSFCLVPLSFIYPSSMHLRAVARTRWVRAKDWALIVVGVLTMVYVTYISIATWGGGGSELPPS